MTLENLQIPVMRSELVHYLDHVLNQQLHVETWATRSPDTHPTLFMYIFHFFFDDTSLSSDPSSCIGVFLLNEQEADAIRALTTTIELMLERHGWPDNDGDFLRRPEWPAVVEAARKAYALISPGTPTIEEARAAMPDRPPA